MVCEEPAEEPPNQLAHFVRPLYNCRVPQSPLPDYLAVLPRHKRPTAETSLSTWLRARGINQYQFARMIGADERAVSFWACNQSLPTLIFAFRIEQVTQGGVPVSSWLGTALGRILWKARDPKQRRIEVAP